MNEVFLLWHVHEFEDGNDDEKLIGVYRTEDETKAAIERVRTQPGFADLPNGFSDLPLWAEPGSLDRRVCHDQARHLSWLRQTYNTLFWQSPDLDQ